VKLHTASFYDPQDWLGAPVRVSHQHPRGVKAQWEVLPGVYPSGEIYRAFRAGRITAEEFAVQYRALLDERYAQDKAFRQWLASHSTAKGDVTFLCFERGDRFCHRRVLAAWLHERFHGAMCLGMLR
jgi:uncharacterized protein YeaO (DUF488 family)